MEAIHPSRHSGLPAGRLHGQCLTTRKVASLTLTDTAYAPGCRISRHSHQLAQLCLVQQGAFSEIFGRRSREVESFTLIVRPQEEAHSHRFHNDGARCFVLEIGNDCLRRVREHSRAMDDSTVHQGGVLRRLGITLYNEFQEEDNASSLAIEGLTFEILAEISRSTKRDHERTNPSWLDQAREFVHAHFARPITLTEIAEAVDIHPTHLARTFRQVYHCSIGAYVRRLRIEFACREASSTDMSLTEIALAAGFYDQSHFSKTFKAIVGLTPSQYRAAFRSR